MPLSKPPRFVAGAGQDKTLRTATQNVVVVTGAEATGVVRFTPTEDKNMLIIVDPTDVTTIDFNGRNMKAGDTFTCIAIGEGTAVNFTGTIASPAGATSGIGNVYTFICTGTANFGGATIVPLSKFED